MATNIHVNDEGTIVKVRIINDYDGTALDISGAATKQIFIKKYRGDTTAYDADFITDGTDGWMQYIITSGDLDINGTYSIQGHVAGSGYVNSSKIDTFTTYPNLVPTTP